MPATRNLSLKSCADQFRDILACCEVTSKDGATLGIELGISSVMRELDQVDKNKGSVFVIGNGGSAGVSSHAVIDLINVGKLRAFTLHEPSLLTCMANDYGYENAYARILTQIAKQGDLLIAISSSGNSMNIRNAATQMKVAGGKVVTLSGFTRNNALRALGDINIWLDSNDYGLVEIGHQFILHNISDRFGAKYKGEQRHDSSEDN